jgi:DNA-binding MarR family transcriptional regulator
MAPTPHELLANLPPDHDVLRLDAQLCFPVYLASRLMVNAYRPLLEEFGLTYPQYLVLLVLWETDGLSVGALGERLYLETGTLTPLLKRMEKQGLVARKRSRDDDRVVLNWLTEKARAIKPRAQKIPITLMCGAGMDLGELVSLKATIEGLIAKLLPLQQDEPRGAEEP